MKRLLARSMIAAGLAAGLASCAFRPAPPAYSYHPRYESRPEASRQHHYHARRREKQQVAKGIVEQPGGATAAWINPEPEPITAGPSPLSP